MRIWRIMLGIAALLLFPVTAVAQATPTPVIGDLFVDWSVPEFPVYGTAFYLLEPGKPGEVSIVASAVVVDTNSLLIVVHNGTDDWVDVEVEGIVRDGHGKVIATSTGTYMTPQYAGPGGLVFGNVQFDADVPGLATMDLAIRDATKPSEADIAASAGQEVSDFDPANGSITFANSTDRILTLISAKVMCFSNGFPVSLALVPAPIWEEILPADTYVTKVPEHATCEDFLIAAEGF